MAELLLLMLAAVQLLLLLLLLLAALQLLEFEAVSGTAGHPRLHDALRSSSK